MAKDLNFSEIQRELNVKFNLPVDAPAFLCPEIDSVIELFNDNADLETCKVAEEYLETLRDSISTLRNWGVQYFEELARQQNLIE